MPSFTVKMSYVKSSIAMIYLHYHSNLPLGNTLRFSVSPVQKQSPGGGYRRGQEAGSTGSSAQYRLHRPGRRHHRCLPLSHRNKGTENLPFIYVCSIFGMSVTMTHICTHSIWWNVQCTVHKINCTSIVQLINMQRVKHFKMMYGVCMHPFTDTQRDLTTRIPTALRLQGDIWHYHTSMRCVFFYVQTQHISKPCVCVCAEWFSTAARVVGWLCSKAGYAAAHGLRHLSYTRQNNEAVFVSNLTFTDDAVLLLFFLLQWANDTDDLSGEEKWTVKVKLRMQQGTKEEKKSHSKNK